MSRNTVLLSTTVVTLTLISAIAWQWQVARANETKWRAWVHAPERTDEELLEQVPLLPPTVATEAFALYESRTYLSNRVYSEWEVGSIQRVFRNDGLSEDWKRLGDAHLQAKIREDSMDPNRPQRLLWNYTAAISLGCAEGQQYKDGVGWYGYASPYSQQLFVEQIQFLVSLQEWKEVAVNYDCWMARLEGDEYADLRRELRRSVVLKDQTPGSLPEFFLQDLLKDGVDDPEVEAAINEMIARIKEQERRDATTKRVIEMWEAIVNDRPPTAAPSPTSP